MMNKLHLVLLFVLILLVQIIKSDNNGSPSFLDSKSIQLSLVSNWGETPSYLEAAEFFYKQDKLLFWKFIEEFSSNVKFSDNDNNTTTDKVLYETTISSANTILTKNTQFLKEFLSIDLAIRTFSPRVETYRQIAISNENYQINKLNGGWIQINKNKVITNVNEITDSLFEKQQQQEDTEQELLYEFDHIYPTTLLSGSKKSLPTVILYSDIKSEFFKQAHPKLKQLSKFGKINYILRYLIQESNQKLNLQGYGFELSIKNLEYKVMDDSAIKKDIIIDGIKSKTIINIPNEDVEGFNFHKLQKRRPELTSKLSTFRSYLMAKGQEAKELKVWELKDLGIQSSQKIITSMEPMRSLEYISQKFPTLSNSLSKISLNETLKNQIELNQKIIPSTETTLLLNGRLIETSELSPVELSDIILSEYESVSILQQLLTGSSSSSNSIIQKLISNTLPIRINLLPNEEEIELSDPIISLNNLESDYSYRSWNEVTMDGSLSKDVTSPGDIFFRKNLLSTIIILDWNNVNTFDILPEIQQMLQTTLIPSRFSIVFYTGSGNSNTEKKGNFVPAKDLAKVFLAFKNSNLGNRGALFFITALNYFKKMYGPNDLGINRSVFSTSFQTVLQQMGGNVRSLQAVLSNSEYDDLLTSSNQYVERLFGSDISSTSTSPMIFLNGIQIEYSNIDQLSFDLLVSLYDEFDRLKPLYKNGIINEKLTSDQIFKTILTTNFWNDINYPVLLKSNPIILNEKYAHLITSSKNQLQEHEAQNVLKNLLYLSNSKVVEEKQEADLISLIIVGDFDNYNTREISLELLNQIKDGKLDSTRLTFISNPIGDGSAFDNDKQIFGKLISILKNYSKKLNIESIIKLFEIVQLDPTIIDRVKSVKELLEISKLNEIIPTNDIYVGQATNLFKQSSKVSKEYLSIESTNKTPVSILINGRIITPIQYDDISNYINNQFNIIHKLELLKAKSTLELIKQDSQIFEKEKSVSDLINKVQSVLGYYYKSSGNSGIRKRIPSCITRSFTHVPKASGGDVPLKFLMIINPFNKVAQKLVPMVQEFSNKLNIPIDVVLNPPVSVSELPLKTYYTYVIKLDSEFNLESGGLINQPFGIATNIPEERVVTLSLDVPSSWLVQPIIAKYDLDNIRLKDLGDEQVLTAIYELENIVIEGSANDITTDSAPAGLELQLTPISTQFNFTQDTIVMNNFGYYQLKSNPGIWKLAIAQGRSSDIMDIVEHPSLKESTVIVVPHRIVVIDSLYQSLTTLSVVRKPGQESKPILQPIDEYEKQKELEKEAALSKQQNGFFSNLFGKSSNNNKKSHHDTIHIFSVASGHLYERFLKIMMLSVVKNTESPVKFWFLKNYLSPGFKEFIPHMAKEYGFEYELVTYKWPWWLRKQTEKQRIIWSYKILFLDVLFPLDVPKIIFVDADQVVRTDIKELWDMDLHGASLGYTPFCDSNKDTEGFRFWKSGYWKQHLAGRPYHISALYVVDLVRFRRLAAGDQLRATYDQLSRDPNSLANLDQDLPNYLQQYVKIHSLPQEWLWCETWCDQDSKSKAKTIDLCNNPLTKTPKLENAVRIIDEWTSLDNEAKEFELKVDSLNEKSSQSINSDSKPSILVDNLDNILSNLADSQKDLF